MKKKKLNKQADRKFIIIILIVVALTISSIFSILNYNLNNNNNFEKQIQRINRLTNPTNIKLIECIESINIYDADVNYETNLNLQNVTNSDECTNIINVSYFPYSLLENNNENTTTIIITKLKEIIKINSEL